MTERWTCGPEKVRWIANRLFNAGVFPSRELVDCYIDGALSFMRGNGSVHPFAGRGIEGEWLATRLGFDDERSGVERRPHPLMAGSFHAGTLDAEGNLQLETWRASPPDPLNEGDAEIDAMIMENPHLAESVPLDEGTMRSCLKEAVAEDPGLIGCFAPERARELGLDQG